MKAVSTSSNRRQFIKTFGLVSEKSGSKTPAVGSGDHKYGNICVVEWMEVGHITKLRKIA